MSMLNNITSEETIQHEICDIGNDTLSTAKYTKISDTNLVQITVSNDEINKRIQAFLTRKRQQINEQNIQEFCHKHINDENPFSCARVDAVFVRQKDSKSHIKVHRIENSWGPQTVDTSTFYKKLRGENANNDNSSVKNVSSVIEKRLCVNVPVSKEIYEKLKQIEERLENYHKKIKSSDSPAEPDDNTIQIKASNEEINIRIETFIKRKREQINEQNVREFCHRDINDENEFSCARVDAVFVKQKDSKSHLKVHRIVNTWGPQTVESSAFYNKLKMQVNVNNLNSPLEERIFGIEQQLGIAKQISKDIHQRLKQIEDYMLYHESISPEYMNFLTSDNEDTTQNIVKKKKYSSVELNRLLKNLQYQYVRKID